MSEELEMTEEQRLADESSALKKRAKDEGRELTESEQNRIARNKAKVAALHGPKPRGRKKKEDDEGE